MNQLTAASLALFCLAGIFGGCAANNASPAMSVRSVQSAPLPANQEEAHFELARLETEIERNRIIVGLPARRVDQLAVKIAPEERADRTRMEPPSDVSPESTASAPGREYERDAEAGPDPCRHTHAICNAAARICRIAEFLAEAKARQSCARAKKDCEEAKEKSGC